MASASGTFTTTGQRTTGFHYLRPTEVVRTTLTVTGTASVQLCRSIGPALGMEVLQTFTASGTYDYRNQSRDTMYLFLLVSAISGSTAYTFADITGDQVLAEDPRGGWFRADGTRVGYMSDEGFVGPVLTPPSQGGAANLYDQMTPDEIDAAQAGVSPPDISTAFAAMMTAAGAMGRMVIPAGIYAMNNVSGSLSGQQFYAQGRVIIRKNANGPLFTHSGDNVVLDMLEFDGEAATYSGDNVVLTGNRPYFRSSSYDAAGRALKATGQRVIVAYANNIIATADQTAAGYDIEIGISNTPTLYHAIEYTSTQPWGGLLLIDTGSHTVNGGQFYKYTWQSGTSPNGVNAGELWGSRILGPISIDISNGSIRGVALGLNASVTFGTGTTGLWIDAAVETTAGGAWVNNGNPNNVMIRQYGDGADGTVSFKYGPDTSAAVWKVVPDTGGTFIFPQLQIPNNKNYRGMRASPNEASTAWTLGASASDNVSFNALIGSHQRTVPTGQVYQDIIGSVVKGRLDASGRTLADGTTSASPGGAASDTVNVKPVTAIANGVATTVATITIPNAAHSFAVRFTIVGSLGAGGAIGANEATATNTYVVAGSRTAGVNAVLAISSASGAATPNVAGGATITATLALAAVSGAVGATNTCAVQVTITAGSGSSTNHTALVVWEVMNANASGVTVA